MPMRPHIDPSGLASDCEYSEVSQPGVKLADVHTRPGGGVPWLLLVDSWSNVSVAAAGTCEAMLSSAPAQVQRC